MKRILTVVLIALLSFGVMACEDSKTSKNNIRRNDENAAARQLEVYQQAQPVPSFDSSQLRKNLIDIETTQSETTQTTTFFFNQGVANPISSCPSIGYPIPSTAQLTNPEYKVPDQDVTLPQIEANGIYTGDSTGTYAICVNDAGEAYGFYWEGFVSTVTGPAVWDKDAGQIKLTGTPTGNYSESK